MVRAARDGHVEMVRLLAGEFNANVNARNKKVPFAMPEGRSRGTSAGLGRGGLFLCLC